MSEDTPDLYEVMGGQGHRRIGQNLTRQDAEALRRDFDRKCDRAGLMNPPTLIRRQSHRYPAMTR